MRIAPWICSLNEVIVQCIFHIPWQEMDSGSSGPVKKMLGLGVTQ